MKHSLLFIFITLCLTACETREEPVHFELDAKPAYAFTETAGTAFFSVTANISWKAAVTAGGEWCRVTPGAEKGDGKVEISVTENTAYLQERTATIKVTADAFEAEITITQAPPPCPDFNPGSIGHGGQTIFIGSTPATINSVEEASGGGVISYQWYKNGVAINGATAATYTPPAADVAVVGTYTYTRSAKDDVCNTTLAQSAGSWALSVVACSFSAGTISSAGETIFAGGAPATINSVQDASGGDGISYQWFKNGIAIDGATAATYTPPPADVAVVGAYTHTYTRSAKDKVCNTTFTQSAGSWMLVVICNFSAGTISSAGQAIVVGGAPVTINSIQDASGGDGISYQWYKNSAAINGATAATYTPPTTDAATTGAYTYTRRAKDNICQTTLTPSAGSWVLTVASCTFSAGTIATGGQTICSGSAVSTITSSADASGGDGNVTYQWRQNGSTISGATAATYSPVSYNTTVGAHTFTRWAHDGSCKTAWTQSAGSWALTVTEGAKLTLTTDNSTQTIVNGAAIAPIRYTTTNASTVTCTYLPVGITGAWASNTLTISGSSTVTGTHVYIVTAFGTEGCGNVYASGNITIYAVGIDGHGCATSNLTLGNVGFASTVTHVVSGAYGSQTWSAPVTATYCAKTAYNCGNWPYAADCRSNTQDDYGALFSWCMANQYAAQLCPSPWHMPTADDYCILYMNLEGQSSCESGGEVGKYLEYWGGQFGGMSNPSGTLGGQGKTGIYWFPLPNIARNVLELYYPFVGFKKYSQSEGFTIRCVK